MKIQVGEIKMDELMKDIKVNSSKTKKYLLPCLREYGEEFTKKISSVVKIAAGIGDIIISNRGVIHEKHIFILLDSTIAPKFFISFIDWIRDQPQYQDDYVFGNIQTSRSHMIIIKLPEKYYKTFETFKLGKYSEMYTKQDIDVFFKDKPLFRRVILKDHNYKFKFVEEVNERFNSTVDAKDWHGELDFPPDDKEIFNSHLKKK